MLKHFISRVGGSPRRRLWAAAVLLPLALLAQAPEPEYPGWWYAHGLVGEAPPATANTTAYAAWVQQNYAPANLGQLKHFAWQARSYLDEELVTVGGAGPSVDALVDGFDDDPALNYAAVNLGQYKAVLTPLYERLLQVGYGTKANLNYQMTGNASATTWAYDYPWPDPPPGPGEGGYNGTAYAAWVSQNYAPLNLGQLKLGFSFTLGNFTLSENLSTRSDGIPDWWLVANGLDPFNGSIADATFYGGNMTNQAAYAAYVSGNLPGSNEAFSNWYNGLEPAQVPMALPGDPVMTLPRVIVPKWAVIDLGLGTLVDMNYAGDVLMLDRDAAGNVTGTSLWSQGNKQTLPTTFGIGNTATWLRACDDGTVTGIYTGNIANITGTFPARWIAGNEANVLVDFSSILEGSESPPYLGRREFLRNGDVIQEVLLSRWVHLGYGYVSPSEGNVSHGYWEYYYALARWSGDDEVEPAGSVLMYQGDAGNMTTNEWAVCDVFTTVQENTLQYRYGGYAYNSPVAVEIERIDYYEEPENEWEEAGPPHYANLTYDAVTVSTVSEGIMLDGAALSGVGWSDAFALNRGIASLAYPMVLDPTHTHTLFYKSTGLVADDWPTNPGNNTAVHLKQVNSLGLGLTTSGNFWLNGQTIQWSGNMPGSFLGNITSLTAKQISDTKMLGAGEMITDGRTHAVLFVPISISAWQPHSPYAWNHQAERGYIPRLLEEDKSDPAKLEVPVNDDNDKDQAIFDGSGNAVSPYPADNYNGLIDNDDPDLVRFELMSLPIIGVGCLTLEIKSNGGNVTLALGNNTANSTTDIRLHRVWEGFSNPATYGLDTPLPFTLDLSDPGNMTLHPLESIIGGDAASIAFYLQGIQPDGDNAPAQAYNPNPPYTPGTAGNLTKPLTLTWKLETPDGTVWSDEVRMTLLGTRKLNLRFKYNGNLTTVAGGNYSEATIRNNIKHWLQSANNITRTIRYAAGKYLDAATEERDVMVPVVFRAIEAKKDADTSHYSLLWMYPSNQLSPTADYQAAGILADQLQVADVHVYVVKGFVGGWDGVAINDYGGRVLGVRVNAENRTLAHEWLHAFGGARHASWDRNIMSISRQYSDGSTDVSNRPNPEVADGPQEQKLLLTTSRLDE